MVQKEDTGVFNYIIGFYMDDISPNVVLPEPQIEERVKAQLIDIVRKKGTDDLVDCMYLIIKQFSKSPSTARLDISLEKVLNDIQDERDSEASIADKY